MAIRFNPHTYYSCSDNTGPKGGSGTDRRYTKGELERKVSQEVERFNPEGSYDVYADALEEIAGGNLSAFSSEIGVWMLKNNFDYAAIEYVTSKANDYSLSKRGRNRGNTLVCRWLDKNRSRQDFEFGADLLLDNIESLVSSQVMYITAKKLIGGAGAAEMANVEFCLSQLGSYTDTIKRLPEDIKSVFYSIVDQTINHNKRLADSQPWRYDHILCKALESFKPYTTRHNKDTYGLIRKVKQKDARNTLFDMYGSIGNLPRGLPENVRYAVDKALDNLPDDGVLEEPLVKKIYQFILTISRSCQYHQLSEMETFFELEADLDECSEKELPVHLQRLVDILDKSTKERYFTDVIPGAKKKKRKRKRDGDDSGLEGQPLITLAQDIGDEVYELFDTFSDSPRENSDMLLRIFTNFAKEIGKVYPSQSRARRISRLPDNDSKSLGFKYLQMSQRIGLGPCYRSFPNAVFNFARDVNMLHSACKSKSEIIEFMQLYMRTVVLDEEELEKVEKERFHNIRGSIGNHETQLIDYGSANQRLSREKPDICTPDLKQHMFDEFGVEVNEMWDLRKSQFLLYLGRKQIDDYEELAKDRMDPDFVIHVVEQMKMWQLLEKKLNFSAGGCGPAVNELLYYDALVRLGFKVHLDLYDKSNAMLSRAYERCFYKEIRPVRYEKNLETLSYADLQKDRQVFFSMIGGTLLNFPDWVRWMGKMGGIFDRRDRLTPDGEYVLKRYNSRHGGRKRDVLLVEADLKKDRGLYERLIDKRFIAGGLHAGFHLTDDALMLDGKYQHTTFLDEDNDVLRCIFLVTQNCGQFKKGQAIRVIDSGIMHEERFQRNVDNLGWECDFIRSQKNTAVAVCVRKRSKDKRGKQKKKRRGRIIVPDNLFDD
ncbi:hypothetical protein ACFL3V_03870 [Nanoarchaeota archaeon]